MKSNKKDNSGKSAGIRKGRFAANMSPEFAYFNASIRFDRKLFRQDIKGSIAHAKMLGRKGIISSEDSELIVSGLLQVQEDIQNGKLTFRDDLEDIHINIEQALKEKIGDVAGKLHTARSRNDQVALDLRLYIIDEIDVVCKLLLELIGVLAEKAEEHIDTILPGYTHLQRAQPVRLAHHLLAYCFMFQRDWERFKSTLKRTSVSPLGSAALAGTTFSIDRSLTAEFLGLPSISDNSMDSVSDRDFALEFLFNCSLTMVHMSRFCEELILWSSSEFNFCSLPDAYCSGSSIMPQKKNPDACELVRGKTGRIFGDLIALLTVMKALPLTYNKDLQEDKEPVFDAVETLEGCLGIMKGLVPGIEFKIHVMTEAASEPTLAATDLADDLARKGLPFREAHEKIGQLVREASNSVSQDLPSPQQMVDARSHPGGTGKKSVLNQLKKIRAFLAKNKREAK